MPTKPIAHESGPLHVTGHAVYIDDIAVTDQALTGLVVTSPHAHARVLSYSLDAARAVPGVFAVLDHTAIAGENQMGPVFHDEICLATDTVEFVGQALFIIAAENEEIARNAAARIEVEYEVLPATLTLEQAIQNGTLLHPPRKIERGNIDEGFANSTHTLEGELRTGAQEHWYLETQVCLAVPGEGRELKIYSSTQHPSETQALVAEVLGIARNEVEVEVRRMGGAFGGKETQANHTAIWAALLAQHTKRPVKIRLFRDDDQKMTGKRHPFLIKYKVGFDADGTLQAIDFDQNQNAGWSTDLSMAVLERAMMHADNAYFVPNIRIIGKAWKTNLPSNTAFRGFGGPKGIAAMETVIDRVARYLTLDAAKVRHRNFYRDPAHNTTPYGQTVEHNRLELIWEQLIETSAYHARRAAVANFNAEHEFVKKGLALTPVKFGISFTASHLNQAGALVHIYQDGTVLVNHGGTEMGQGLHTKIQLIAAAEFGLSPERIKVNATNTAKVPNTSATAASAGTDLNGAAVKNAIDVLKARLLPIAADMLDCAANAVVLANDEFTGNGNTLTFEKVVQAAYFKQVQLSTTGFYKTPDIHFNRDTGKGKPYHYFAFGMAVSEVTLDTLTGFYTTERVDILHDVGNSLNPRIDRGQIEGGFVQGVGWCTTEECKWNDKGELLNHSPDTYKIPNVQDIPRDFRVDLLQNAPNANTIRSSKAVGEPPFMLCFSTWLAIKDAISAVGNHSIEPPFQLPATNEQILLSVEQLRRKMG